MTTKHLKWTETPLQFPEVANAEAIWWKTAVFYEIYPRSFQDTNDDGIGDLRGIEERMPYLRDLGIDAIWVTPFYQSPMADFGYDVSDYTAVDPIFGSLADFDRLVAAAHRHNIRVVIDFVPNHTSSQNSWFLESCSSRTNPKRDWYIWADAKQDKAGNRIPPNNWPSFFGGPAWTWDEATQQYYLHLFLDRQPDLNWRNPKVVEAMHNAMRFWLEKGVDGFRLDAINYLSKHPDMPDIPFRGQATAADLAPYHIYTNNQPELHTILKDFRRLLDSYPGNRVLIGETAITTPEKLVEFYGKDNDEIQLPMLFLPLCVSWEAKAMRECLLQFYAGAPAGATLHFVFGNHDDLRVIDRYGVENHRSAGMLLLTLLGSPILYYGDEIGMVDVVIPPEKRQDPFDVPMTEHSIGRDPARTPMQWSTAAHAGFTSAEVEPWLPVNNDLLTNSVEVQEKDPQSTLNFYKQLLHLRRTSATLRQGSIQFLEGGNNDVLAYLRQSNDETLLIVINFTSETQHLDLSALADSARCLFTSAMKPIEITSLEAITLRPNESMIIQLG